MSIFSIIFGQSKARKLEEEEKAWQREKTWHEEGVKIFKEALEEALEIDMGKDRQIAQLNSDIGQYKQEAEILRAELATSRYRIAQLTREIEDFKNARSNQ